MNTEWSMFTHENINILWNLHKLQCRGFESNMYHLALFLGNGRPAPRSFRRTMSRTCSMETLKNRQSTYLQWRKEYVNIPGNNSPRHSVWRWSMFRFSSVHHCCGMVFHTRITILVICLMWPDQVCRICFNSFIFYSTAMVIGDRTDQVTN